MDFDSSVIGVFGSQEDLKKDTILSKKDRKAIIRFSAS